MGAAQDWGVPLALGALVFAALAAWPHGDDGPDGNVASTILEVFPGHVRSDRSTQVLFVDHERAHGVLNGTFFSWRTPHVAVGTTEATWPDCNCTGSMFHVAPAAGEPRLGEAGYNATRVTVHVFDAAGELVFSNGNASEQARLTRTLTPEQLPTGTWYLGANATAPAGTQKPPLAAQAFLPQVRHLIQGLPVGGVTTTQTDALATWYGTLFVTLRVDELVQAP